MALSVPPEFAAQFSPDPQGTAGALPPLDPAAYTPGLEARASSLGATQFGPPPPKAPKVPPLGYDPATQEVFVNGMKFHADDHRAAVESVKWIDAPEQRMPSNFQPVSPGEYNKYVRAIQDPTFGRMASKNFDIGMASGASLFGHALRAIGAEQAGQRIVDRNRVTLERNEPYQRTATETDWTSANQAAQWFVANLAQFTPMMLESLAVGVAGAVAGGAAPGVFAGLGGLALRAGGRAGMERGVISAAQRYAANPVAASAADIKILSEAASASAAAQATGAVERAALGMGHATNLLKTAGRAGGALGASTANLYGIGVGDIYGEMQETGTEDRGTAFLAAVPYAAVSLIPEFGIAARALGGLKAAGGKGGIAKRALTGAGLGAVAEGASEAAEEGIVLGATGQFDLSNPEVRDRLINSFAAGAGAGGPMGAFANVAGGRQAPPPASQAPTDLLGKPPQGALPAPPPTPLLPPPSGPALIERAPIDVRYRRTGLATVPPDSAGYPDVYPGAPAPTLALPAPVTRQLSAPPPTLALPAPPPVLALPAPPPRLLTAPEVVPPAPPIPSAPPPGVIVPPAPARVTPAIPSPPPPAVIALPDASARLKRGAKGKSAAPVAAPAPAPVAAPTSPGTAPTEGERRLKRGAAARKAVETRKAGKTALNLFEFIAAAGGIRPGDKNISDLHTVLGRKQHLVPLYGALIRKGGLTMDEARARAEEAGYIGRQQGGEYQTTDLTDFLEAMDRQARGSNVYSGADIEQGQELDRRKGAEQESDREAEALREITALARERGVTLSEDGARDAAALVRQGRDELDAISEVAEREALEGEPTGPGAPRGKEERELGATMDEARAPTPPGKKKLTRKKSVASTTMTAEALEIIDLLDRPTTMTDTLRRIAEENGIKVEKGTTAGDITDGLDEKAKRLGLADEDGLTPAGLKMKDEAEAAPTPAAQTKSEGAQPPSLAEAINALTATVKNLAAKAAAVKAARAEGAASKGKAKLTKGKPDEPTPPTGGGKKRGARPRVNIEGPPPAKGAPSAVQKPSAKSVDVQKPPGDGTEVSGRDIDKGDAAEAGAKKTKAGGKPAESKAEPVAEVEQEPAVGEEQQSADLKALEADTREITQRLMSGRLLMREHLDAISTLFRRVLFPEKGFDRDTRLFQFAMEDQSIWGEEAISEAADELLFEIVTTSGELQAEVRGKDGTVGPARWLTAVDQRELLHEVAANAKITGLPLWAKRQIDRKQVAAMDPKNRAAYLVAHHIDNLFKQSVTGAARGFVGIENDRVERGAAAPGPDDPTHKKTPAMVSQEIEAKFENANNAYPYRDGKLGDWFDKKGRLNWVPLSDRTNYSVPSPKGTEPMTQAEYIKKYAPGATMDEKPSSGKFSRTDGSKITASLSYGRAKLLLGKLLSKFVKAPKTMLFRNLADLKRRNPEVYARAAAAWTGNGSFDSIADKAAGYSFGNEVLIFSDMIVSEQHLAAVLAHEAIGHFGLRSIVPAAELDSVLESIYKEASPIREAADRNMAVHNMGRSEAIEEALADWAAVVDTSLIRRAIHAVKNFMNKLGVKFGDDVARYYVTQARAYTRTGKTSHVSSATAMGANIASLAEMPAVGRFSRDATSGPEAESPTGMFEAFFTGMSAERPSVPGVLARLKKNPRGTLRAARRDIQYLIEQLQSSDYKGRKSAGLTVLHDLFRRRQAFSNQFKAELSAILKRSTGTPWNDAARKAIGFFGIRLDTTGPTKAQALKVGRHLRVHAIRMKAALEKKYPDLDEVESLFNADRTGINEEAIARIREFSAISLEETNKGLDIPIYDNDLKPVLNADGTQKTRHMDVPPMTEEEYVFFKEMSEARDKTAEKLLESKLEGMTELNGRTLNKVRPMFNIETDEWTAAQSEALDKITNAYFTIQDEKGRSEADAFLRDITRAFHSDAKLESWKLGRKTVMENGKPVRELSSAVFDEDGNFKDDYAWVASAIESLRVASPSEHQSNKVKQVIGSLYEAHAQVVAEERRAKQTIMGAYVPFERHGKFQVRVAAVDAKTGLATKLPEELAGGVWFSRADSQAAADADMEFVRSKIFPPDKVFRVKVGIEKDGTDKTADVRFEVRSSEKHEAPALDTTLDYDAFAIMIQRFGIKLEPQQHEHLVTVLSAGHARALANLVRTGNPGENVDTMQHMFQYFERQTHIASKNRYRHAITDTMAEDDLWRGSDKTLSRLQKDYKVALAAGNRTDAFYAGQRLQEYQFMYLHMAEVGKSLKMMRPDGSTHIVEGLGRGETSRVYGLELAASYEQHGVQTGAISETLLNHSGLAFTVTTAAQLGMSLAAAITNLTSLPVNVQSYFASYNVKHGFGGGFGAAKTAAAIALALHDMSTRNLVESRKLGKADYLSQILKDGSYTKFGLTKDETEYLVEMTKSGEAIATMNNALTATARADKTHPAWSAALDAWMAPFNYTEQVNRRVTALVSYRLEKERMLASSLDPTSDAGKKELIARGTLAINATQGNYSQWNVPAWARGGFMKYPFMYKQYLITSDQLLVSMDKKGRINMLAALFILGGLKGLPGAEDLMNIFDALMQKFGVRMQDLTAEIAKLADSLIPGAGKLAIGGLADLAGASIGARTTLGKQIPGADAFRAGADPYREISAFLGPVYSAATDTYATASGIAAYAAGKIGIREDVTSISQIARNSPVSAIRAWTDALLYTTDGYITSAKGQVVSPDVGVRDIIVRALGFYPTEVAEQQTIVRMAENTKHYAQQFKKEFVDAYSLARNDPERRAQIVETVRRWNESVGKGPFYIRNFTDAANRAAREDARSLLGRYTKSQPRDQREITQEMIEIYGLEETAGDRLRN